MPAARIQPQGRSRLNRANPLTKGALAVVSAFSDINAATGAKLTATGPRAKVAQSAGVASQFRKNWYLETEVLPAIGTQTFVEFWHGYPIAFGAGGAASEAGFVTGSANNQLGICINGRNGEPSWGAVYSWTTINQTAKVLPLGVLTTLVCVRRQDRMELWRNGVLVQSFTQGPASYPATSLILGAFIQDTGYWSSSSDTLLAGRIVGDWSADQVKSFSANPWQLFEEQAPMLSAASAPAGGGATASPAGVSAASAVGTATASGAASSTAQPAGVSAAASVGASVATGQAKASPAGVSASSAVGAATATGQAITTAYPAGVQAIAAVGSATTQGTAIAAPPGVSSAIYVGTAYAYGPFDKLYATTLMRLDTVNRQGGALKDAFAAQSAIRATQACNSLMRVQPINLTSAMRSDPINRTAGLL